MVSPDVGSHSGGLGAASADSMLQADEACGEESCESAAGIEPPPPPVSRCGSNSVAASALSRCSSGSVACTAATSDQAPLACRTAEACASPAASASEQSTSCLKLAAGGQWSERAPLSPLLPPSRCSSPQMQAGFSPSAASSMPDDADTPLPQRRMQPQQTRGQRSAAGGQTWQPGQPRNQETGFCSKQRHSGYQASPLRTLRERYRGYRVGSV